VVEQELDGVIVSFHRREEIVLVLLADRSVRHQGRVGLASEALKAEECMGWGGVGWGGVVWGGCGRGDRKEMCRQFGRSA
jgi:hypothetical protein